MQPAGYLPGRGHVGNFLRDPQLEPSSSFIPAPSLYFVLVTKSAESSFVQPSLADSLRGARARARWQQRRRICPAVHDGAVREINGILSSVAGCGVLCVHSSCVLQHPVAFPVRIILFIIVSTWRIAHLGITPGQSFRRPICAGGGVPWKSKYAKDTRAF